MYLSKYNIHGSIWLPGFRSFSLGPCLKAWSPTRSSFSEAKGPRELAKVDLGGRYSNLSCENQAMYTSQGALHCHIVFTSSTSADKPNCFLATPWHLTVNRWKRSSTQTADNNHTVIITIIISIVIIIIIVVISKCKSNYSGSGSSSPSRLKRPSPWLLMVVHGLPSYPLGEPFHLTNF